jgi:hypothetical protein
MASLSSCSVRDRDYQSGAGTVDVDTYQALTVCILALVVCKSLFRFNAVRRKVDCLSGGAPMALEIEPLFLDAETGAKRCLERVTSARTQDRKKSGNRSAQSRQKVRFLIGGGLGGFGETGWWARQGSNQFLGQKATLPICQRPSCNRSSFCAIPLKSFIFVAQITF